MYEQFDIPEVGQEQDSYQPTTKETKEEGERKMRRLTYVTPSWICKGKPASEQSVCVQGVLFLLLFNSLYLHVIILLLVTSL